MSASGDGDVWHAVGKLLLKRAFDRELELFLAEAGVRHDPLRAPCLYRAYQRVLRSPLLAPEETGRLEMLLDCAPRLNRLVQDATGRKLARQVTRVIAASWASRLRPAAANAAPEDYVVAVGSEETNLAAEDRADVLMFSSRWAEEGLDESEEDQPQPDPLALDPALAIRRKRRRAFEEALSRMVATIDEKGVGHFRESLRMCESFETMPWVYSEPIRRFFSLLRLGVLDGLSVKRNRKKAASLLDQVPSTAMNLLLKIANPISLMHLGAKLSVSIRMPFCRNLLQVMLATATALADTEDRLKAAKKKIGSAARVKELLQAAVLIREEPPGIVRDDSLAKFTNEDEVRVVRLEIRRLEKMDLVNWGGTPEAKGKCIRDFTLPSHQPFSRSYHVRCCARLGCSIAVSFSGTREK